MNEREHEVFEAELRRLKPARLPDEFESRLNSRPPMPSWEFETRQRRGVAPRRVVMAPLARAGYATRRGVAVRRFAIESRPEFRAARGCGPGPTLKADQVRDRPAVASAPFDAVANMPDGDRCAFRFQQ